MPHEPGHIVDQDQFSNLLADLVIDDFLAQRDATNVERVNQNFQTGTPEDFLRQILGLGVDFSPGVGDFKAAFIDAPQQFREGQNIMGAVSLLSALPFGLGLLGDIIRQGGKGAADVLRSTTGARADALAPLRSSPEAAQASAEATGSLLDRIRAGGRGGEGGGRLQQGAVGATRQLDDLAAIRQQIFRDLQRPDPFGDVAAQQARNIEDIEALATRRSLRRDR